MKFRVLTGWILLLGTLAAVLTGCSPVIIEPAQPLTVYATFYPIYALSDMITTGVPELELHCLVQPQDGCIRAYELSDWDIYITAYSADIVISGGSGLESFSGTLETMAENDLALAEMLYGLDMYKGTGSSDDSESHLEGENPHLYMSWDGAMGILRNISAAMSLLDEQSADIYAENLSAAIEEIEELKRDATEIMEPWTGEPVALMSESLIYVANDYHLNVVEWIDRESGTNYYDRDLSECVDRLIVSGAKIVLIEKQAPAELIQAIENAGIGVAALDIMSTGREEEGSAAYIDAMRTNAVVLAETFQRISMEEEN